MKLVSFVLLATAAVIMASPAANVNRRLSKQKQVILRPHAYNALVMDGSLLLATAYLMAAAANNRLHDETDKESSL
ncbi:hypothetical protein GQ43DRAFT_480100 [Delitschia confertaspora ATCC 74209]|uniref:Uncharacterized protein n=1 Tax=Delitschia confertaspora ATCC 74209 TaxID=1513339 RepID=A0A9P4MQU0_9PLEO|nr:hypothetical protein GQ43DRAFT_480100 [Delitschia confertaspora ATCC 74209]